MKSDDQESLDVDEAVDIDLPDVDMDPFSGIKPFLLSAIPLLLLFLLKFSTKHVQDGLLIFGLLLTAFRLNSTVVRLIQLKRDYSKIKCLTVFFICAGIIAYLDIALEDVELKKIFTFESITGKAKDGIGAVWCILYSDGIFKLATVGAKALVVMSGPQVFSFFRRGCLLSIVELASQALRAIFPGMQLTQYIFNDTDDAFFSRYFCYLVFVCFIIFKLYQVFIAVYRIRIPLRYLLNQPELGKKVKVQDVFCDLSQRTLNGEAIRLKTRHSEQFYLEEDFYHWMATYGVHPETGVAMCPIPGGNGHTSMKITLY